jgi:hypothetical protein
MLGARHADRDWKAKLCPHATPYRVCNFSRRTEEMSAPRNVGKGLVDRNPLHQRREIIEHVDGSVTQSLVFLEVATDKDQLRTKLARPPSGHSASDPKGLGFV